LLVVAGEHKCAIPLNQVRRVTRALTPHPLPGGTPELVGLAEFEGEPITILDLKRLVNAAPAATPLHPVTIIAWAGPPNARESVGLAADSAESIVELAMTEVVGGRSGLVWGEAAVAGQPLRVLNLELLGSEQG
jgi:chemotaxis signal transduction protein